VKHVEIRRQKFIVVPIDVVWQIVEPAETLPSWFPMCDRCEVLSGEGHGRRQRMHARWRGRAAEIDAEVTEHRPSSRLVWRHLEERVDGKPAPRISSAVTMTVELHAEGAGTRVVLTSRHVPAAWWSIPLLRLMAGPRIGKAFDQALARLAGSGG
jgi:uncharacterized protein YndB with AHSA1/START domain